MRIKMPVYIESAADYRQLVQYMMQFVGQGFHCDTDAFDYVNADGSHTFYADNADALNTLLEEGYVLLGDAVYEIGLECFKL